MKEMSIHKEVNGIFKKKLEKTSKQKKQVRESDKVVKSDQKSASNRSNDEKKCKFCEGIYKPRECPAYGKECGKCKEKIIGQTAVIPKKVHEASTASSDDFVLEEVTTGKEKKATEAFVMVIINNKEVKAKLHTGAEVNVIPLRIYKQVETEGVQMRKTATKLCGYGGTNILRVVGKITVNCKFCDAEE